jgi:hypothetical protein
MPFNFLKNKTSAFFPFRKSALLFAAVFVLTLAIGLTAAKNTHAADQPLQIPSGLSNYYRWNSTQNQFTFQPKGAESTPRYVSPDYMQKIVNNYQTNKDNPIVTLPKAYTDQGYKWDSTTQSFINNNGLATSYESAQQMEANANAYNTNPQTQAQVDKTANQIKSVVSPDSTILYYLKQFVAWVGNGFLWLFSWLVSLGAFLLEASLKAAQSRTYTSSPIVQAGWPIIRDLANMFFSLILLVISFATILRVESYGMKQILWRLVVAALLINFSLVIAGVVIDASNVMTKFFLDDRFVTSNDTGNASISAAILDGLQINRLYDIQNPDPNSPVNIAANSGSGLQGDTGLLKIVLNIFLGSIFMMVTAFVLIASALLFFIRMIALWILLIFAPLAWLAMILPGTRSMWSKWWSEFMKWVIFAPVYAFFIYLTVSVVSKRLLFGGDLAAGNLNSVFANANLGASSFTQSIDIIVNYVILTIFMVAGLVFARSSGVAGASAMANLGTSMRKGATGFVGRWADRSLAKGAESTSRFKQGLSYLSPTAWKQGMAKRRTQQEREAFEVAGGARQDSLNRFWGGPKKWARKDSDMHEYADRAKRARRQTERREITSNNAEELVSGFEKAKQEKQYGKMGAYAQALAEQNDFNELLRHYAQKGEKDWEMSAEGLERFVSEKLINEGGMGKQDALRLGYDLMRAHEANGQWLGRIIKYDKSGQYSFEEDEKDASGKVVKDRFEKARENAFIEWSKQDPQAQARTTGRFSLIREEYAKDSGNTLIKQLTSNGEKMLAAIDPRHGNRLQRHTGNLVAFHFDKELESINPLLYQSVTSAHRDALKEMQTLDQIKKYLQAQQGFVGADPKTGQKRTPQWFTNIQTEKTKEKQPAQPPNNAPWA